jgi:bisphosphoglycerate-independent phosphoglycerate mutase (AlkP superfamily)
MLADNSNHLTTSEPTAGDHPRPVVLLLLDGWGIAPVAENNAIAAAETPTWLSLIREYPVALLTPGEKDLNRRYLTLGVGQEAVRDEAKTLLSLTAILSAAGRRQLKITETERLAALTYFFNGHAEDKAVGEDWKIVSSAAADSVKPTLVLKKIVAEVIAAVNGDAPVDMIVAALPILDLTAQSGNFEAVKKAAEALDKSLRNIWTEVEAKKGVLIISAACGNAERMSNLGTDLIDREMTANPVPLLIVGQEFGGKTIGQNDAIGDDLSLLAPSGTLADLAPTILQILQIPQPPTMTGKSLLD